MSSLFPYANIVAGVLILVVGFCFHWLGQLVSVIDWELATRLGLLNCPDTQAVLKDKRRHTRTDLLGTN